MKKILVISLVIIFGLSLLTVANKTKASTVPVDAQKDNIVPSSYTFLAPLTSEKTIETSNVGNYFNWIFKLAIAICAGLAVIMIIIGGIQWMGDESIFGKTEAKSKITGAIFGLLIALAAYALLNTIDPALTGSGGVKIKQVKSVIEEDEETAVVGIDSTDTIPTGNRKDCNKNANSKIELIEPNNKKLYVCNDISTKVNMLFLKAKDQGIILGGGSYRSTEKQEMLRAKNCGGSDNIYNEKASCKPPTAVPGKSMHESGLAIDFTCNGEIINVKKRPQTKVCFDWLQKNAKDYGLINLGSENWHWSTNGK